MYHSITFGNKNTYDDWHLVPTSRPVIEPPKPKTQYVDIPGADGSIDLTESLAGRPVFSDREGSIEFHVLNDLDGVTDYNWVNVYEEVMGYLHGKFMRMSLEDDPLYFYEGRFSVNSWKTNEDRSTITIDYRLGPYKYEKEHEGYDGELAQGDIDVEDGTAINSGDKYYNHVRTQSIISFNAGDGIRVEGYRMNFFKYKTASSTMAQTNYLGGDHNEMIFSKNGKLTFADTTYCRFSFSKLDNSNISLQEYTSIKNAIRIYRGGKT